MRFTREAFARLTPDERAEFMHLQMSRRHGIGSDYLPEDCSECPSCGYPVVGSGFCNLCLERLILLRSKMKER